MSEHVKISQANGVLTLVLARQEKKNALTDQMYRSLAGALEAAETDPAVRVVLLRSEGDLFTAGNDIGEFAAVAMGGDLPVNIPRFLKALASATKPLVAAVQGKAVGVGTTLLLHCDCVVLADNALLTTPFVSLALVPEACSSLLLPARIGHLRAFSMFALDETVSAKDALAWGLANKVVPLAELVATAEAIALKLARQPLGSVIATKKLMRAAESITQHMDRETAQFVERLNTAEAREAFAAFAERRPPDFSKV
jgi:enoyl-CoA hydratase/carnithine racemase